jgi:hypothetical protein
MVLGSASGVNANASVVERVLQHSLCTTRRRLYFYEVAVADELFRLMLVLPFLHASKNLHVPVRRFVPKGGET